MSNCVSQLPAYVSTKSTWVIRSCCDLCYKASREGKYECCLPLSILMSSPCAVVLHGCYPSERLNHELSASLHDICRVGVRISGHMRRFFKFNSFVELLQRLLHYASQGRCAAVPTTLFGWLQLFNVSKRQVISSNSHSRFAAWWAVLPA